MATNSPDKVDGILGVSARAWDPVLTPLGYEQLTSLSSAAALNPPDGARVAWIQAESQNVRWRDDGTNPSTSVGIILAPGDSIWYTGSLDAIRLIQETASAKVNVSYYGSQ